MKAVHPKIKADGLYHLDYQSDDLPMVMATLVMVRNGEVFGVKMVPVEDENGLNEILSEKGCNVIKIPMPSDDHGLMSSKL